MKTISVVAAVIFKDDKVFATQLRREIREELEVDINVGDLIETIEYDYPAFHLSMKCFACTIAGGSPHLLEHEAAKWLTSMQLGSVDWLPADVTLIPKIETMLEG